MRGARTGRPGEHTEVVPLYGMHDQRDRAESFGSIAEDYDRHRPGYPEALFEDLTASSPTHVLDIACGTGKAAVPFLARGIDVLGVEPDEAMASVARDRGVPVELARFEDWDARGRRFDVMTCGHAWHWLAPASKDRVPGLLTAGGVLARFWNYHVLDPQLVEALDAAYEGLPDSVHRFGHDPSGDPEPPDPLNEVPGMTVLPSRTYRWEGELTAGQWADRIATYSDHQKLGPSALSSLQQRVAAVIDSSGGVVRVKYGTLSLLAVRNED